VAYSSQDRPKGCCEWANCLLFLNIMTDLCC
jgi:hypothetical protein